MKVTREIVVDVPAAREQEAVAAVYALGVMGVEVRSAGPRRSRARRRSQVLAWLPPTDETVRNAEALAARLGPDVGLTWRDVPVTWESAAAPVCVGSRFVLVPPDVSEAVPPGRLPIVLEPGLAFGDGLHPTTALCVEALERLARRLGSVLDVGTGTGVLAIVAAKLGARPVHACDTDPLAVWSARRAAAGNDAEVQVGESLPAGTFDLVIANLYLEPLLALCPSLAERTGGALVVSGFVVGARGQVEERLLHAGLVVTHAAEREGWVCLEARVDRPAPV